jgi:tetratricopeptide (TPR) repeat protein
MLEAVTDNGPVLLAFDDLQFLDPASQEVLFLVTRRPARVPVLFLAGARAGELGGFAWSEQIDLAAFDRPQTIALIHELSTDDNEPAAEIRDAIVRLAQGNPYHVEMLLADWRVHQQDSLVAAESIGDGVALSWTPPADLRATFARQYGEGGLSNDAQHVLQVLAVAGKAMAPHDVASLVGLNEATSEGVVLELLDRGIARVEAGRVSFKNELHRAFVYHAMGTDRRAYHHGQFAARLAARQSQQLQDMLELVHHSIGAGLQSQAMELGELAAENAIAHAAPREAERMLNWLLCAYEVAAGSRLRLLLAYALDAAAQYQRALDALAAWRDETATLADRALAALIRVDAMQRSRLGSDDDAILQAAQQAIALAEQANATPFLVRANYLRMEVALDGGDLTTLADALALAARIAASPASPDCIAMAQLALGQGELAKGEFGAAVAQLTAALPVVESLGLWIEVRRCLNTLGISYRGLGRISDAIRVFQDNVAVAERSGHLGGLLQSHLLLGNIYHDVAWFAAAADCMRTVSGPVEAIRTPRAWAEAYSNIARLSLVLGNLAEAELAVERCEDGARRSALLRHRVTALMTRADFHLAAGQNPLAWRAVEEAMRIAGDRSHLLPDGALYTRLQHQYVFATRGYDALKTLGAGGRLAMFDSRSTRSRCVCSTKR